MLGKSEMLSAVRSQLAVDMNCAPEDFDGEGFVFREAKENPGRRPFPRSDQHFEMLTMGGATVIPATPEILDFVRARFTDIDRDDAFAMPFLRGVGIYFLPDEPRPVKQPEDCEIRIVERMDIPSLYAFPGFRNALSYDPEHLRPDVLAVVAAADARIMGVAGASADSNMLWQIGIDILPEYRNGGLAAALTNRLAGEIMQRGKIPYYGTAISNIASQRVAHRAGFEAAWICAYRSEFHGHLTAPTG